MTVQSRRSFTRTLTSAPLAATVPGLARSQPERRPNILFAIADDWSWPHASAYNDPVIHTPAFDRVAQSGCLMTNVFACAPQCSPNRASILLGRPIWQNQEAGTHSSYFPRDNPVFTDLLEASGYFIGSTGKAWGPGSREGWSRNPVGPSFNERQLESVPTDRMNRNDYAGNFQDFLDARPDDQPFFFWYGASEPHRAYEWQSYRNREMLENVDVPEFLPDHPVIRQDILDYYLEVEWFDRHLGRMLDHLEAIGELDNTLIVVTSDNGMPFPRAKANLYEYGTHMPMAVMWASQIRPGQVRDGLFSFEDLAPTFLQAANVDIPVSMSGTSFIPYLTNKAEAPRSVVMSGRERHSHSRYDNRGYPCRSIRDDRYLLIWNAESDRWPAGTPDWFHDIDASPSLTFLKENRTAPEVEPYFHMATAKRPPFEFFDVVDDPACIHNLAQSAEHQPAMRALHMEMLSRLERDQDPRVKGYGFQVDGYPRFGSMREYLGGFWERGVYHKVRR